MCMKKRSNEVFLTNLMEIDALIKDHEMEEALLEEDEDQAFLIRRKLGMNYSKYADVFSQKASDLLPPHRPYNHKIELTTPLPDSYSLLYKQTMEELKYLKQWLQDNLDKGFIEPCQVPFASPILFVKKADGSLRLCVDYRKLNEITR